MMWEIQESKLAIYLIGLIVVKACRDLPIIRVAEMLVLTVNHDVGDPLAFFFREGDPFIARGVVGIASLVSSVLLIGSLTQVVLSIVERSVSYVVSDRWRGYVENSRCHWHPNSVPVNPGSTHRVKRPVVLGPVSTPRVPSYAFVILGVNEGYLATGERDLAVGWGRGCHARSVWRVGFVRCFQHLTSSFYLKNQPALSNMGL